MGELYRLSFSNGKHYIGIAANGAYRRFTCHRHNATKFNTLLYNAWRKHGEPGLKVLAVIEDDLLYETEIRAIALYGTLAPGGYNITLGGDGIRGLVHTPETRAKMSASRMGHIKSPETCAKLSESHLNLPPETRARITAGSRIHHSLPESRAQKSASTRKTMTPERRAMNAEATRKLMTPEHRARISASLMGHQVSSETRKKLGIAKKLWLERVPVVTLHTF